MIIPYKEGVKCSITGLYGPRTHPVSGKPNFHKGVDMVINDRNVRAVKEGVVRSVNLNADKDSAGRYVTLSHDGDIKISKYFHLDSTTMKVGQAVKCGELIGIMGNTGVGTGPHLHLETWISDTEHVDPMLHLGIKAAIGPVAYLHWAEKDFVQLNQVGASFGRRPYDSYWADQMAMHNRMRTL